MQSIIQALTKVPFQKLMGTTFLVLLSLMISAGSSSASERQSEKSAVSSFDLSNYNGQFVYLDFWASWCGPCRASFPWMNMMHKEFNDKNLKIVSINLDADRIDANEFLNEFPADFEVIFDPKGEYAENYDLLGMPSSFFFDPNGKLLFSHIGFNNKDAPELKQKIQAAITTAQSKPKDKE